MTRLFARALWLLLGWVELLVFTLLLYGLSFLPSTWRGDWYRRLFQAWCRTWIHALGVDLRMHHKNIHPLPERYILIANHPSSFEDVGIPSLFPTCGLFGIETALTLFALGGARRRRRRKSHAR